MKYAICKLEILEANAPNNAYTYIYLCIYTHIHTCKHIHTHMYAEVQEIEPKAL